MQYTMTSPCNMCPFLEKFSESFTFKRLMEFSSGEFPCHKTAALDDDENAGFVAVGVSQHCAGALIFLEKRDRPHQMMRICEQLGIYDRSKLDMTAGVR